MKVTVVGVSQRTAPLAVLERLAAIGDDVGAANRRLAEATGQGVVLHTCNRVEFYSLAENLAQAQEAAAGVLSDYGVAYSGVEPYAYARIHDAAVRHLFRVTCSLDSLVLGESEVLGQVRNAFGAAVAAGTASSPLTHAFHQALRVGKRARHETDIGRNALSVSYAFVELARHALGPLADTRAVVLGAGEAGRLAAQALVHAGVGHLTVMNRTPERAADLAAELGGAAIQPWDELPRAVESCDVLISCTGAPGYVVTRDLVNAAHRPGHRPLLLLDAALPRDVDPAVGDLPGVTVADMRDLEDLAETNRSIRHQEAARVEAIVTDEVRRFHEWWDSLQVAPTLADLRRRTEALRQRELSRALRRLAHLAPEDQATVEALSRALVKKLLDDPVTRLRAEGRPEDVQTLRWLFRLDDSAAAEPAAPHDSPAERA